MKNFNSFAEDEQPWQESFRARRDFWLNRVAGFLTRAGVSPNLLSGLGFLCLAPFAFVVIRQPQPEAVAVAWGFIALHVLLDGLDGPLARFQGRGGLAGSFVDMCCDHAGAIAVVCALTAAGLTDGLIASLYVFSYTASTFAIVLLNMAGRPFRWVLRTKYPLYAMVLAYGLTGVNLLDPALALFIVVTATQVIVGFRRIRHFLHDVDRQAAGNASAGESAAALDAPAAAARRPAPAAAGERD